MVAAEDDGEDEKDKLLLFGDQMTDSKRQMLKGILDSYADVLKDDPGLLKGVSHVIDTGDSPPLRSMPNRICPFWREAIKNALLKGGIIEPSTSPWSSPIVAVRKPDGSIRLCIDFHKLNGVTTPDPYCMPLVEDLWTGLEIVSTCRKLI